MKSAFPPSLWIIVHTIRELTDQTKEPIHMESLVDSKPGSQRKTHPFPPIPPQYTELEGHKNMIYIYVEVWTMCKQLWKSS